ncbi:hypothetical protein [Yersinia pseudotuberculosis]|uniref:hypothetical protein n=1 Tax=Yersinia pseudotuberculosis TaxID=633 RepID=UPI000F6D6970|nr:hypothetical protein [Yersinia pseudotuberculosis]VEE71688.1 bacteriophage tail fiber protein [Yersinia pseudotuberculosis]
MQKIGDIPNTRADSNGEFTDGNVAAGVPPTILPAEWFNTIQRELMSILSAADIEADSEEFDQISRAILKLVSNGIDANKFLKTDNNLSEIAAAGPSAVLAAITNLNLLTTVNNANGALQVTRNLSDLNDTAAARTNLGLGGASSLNVGTTAGTVAAGNDSRIVGALQKSGGTIAGNLTVNGAISTSNLIDTIGISMKGGQTVVQGDGNIIGTGSAFGANGLVAALQDKIEGVRVTAISSQTGGTSPVGAFFVALNDSVQYFRYIQISKNGVWSTITT